ncbi:hypothetical protein BDB00DRAFT_924455 [Zychaea mexicana]|uniref:uncharacterized protein n=1 Tax=Zychaea mexicana TaxID=64656 RepID=UPI0022FEB993|nr:uncharacterized protein BDB00DRAFT_924455 [Zychaea mexicana]KAI9499180.1 hypothetical protein BDB00DRAFT_924455 [Zychaea mexicana]
MPSRPGFLRGTSSSRTLSFEESQFFDAVDGTITFEGYNVLSDVHKFVQFDDAMVLVVIENIGSSGTSSAEAAGLDYWMNMASEHSSSQFTILADRADYKIHQHNVHVRIGDVHSLDDDIYDFVHVLRVIPQTTWPSLLEELIRVTKLGGCIQTVQFELKAKGKGPQLLLDFIGRNQEQQRAVLNKSVHVVQESSNSFELGNARSRDPSGFELLLGLIKNMVRSEKLMANPPEQEEEEEVDDDNEGDDAAGDDEQSRGIMDALRNGPQFFELANSVTLVEKLA